MPDLLAPNSTVLFTGDSVTDCGRNRENADDLGFGYAVLAASWYSALFPEKRVHFLNRGISGNRVPDLLARVDRDVIAQKPTLTIIYIGINDVWHWQLLNKGTPKPDYEAGLKELIAKIRSAGSQVILCTPSVIGEKRTGTNTMDTMLAEYAGISRSVARAMQVQLLDLNAAFADYLQAHNPEDAGNGILTADGVHLNAAGNAFVAEQIAGLNPAPIVESGIPRVTYSDPEVASVGVTEATAKELYGEGAVETLEYNLGGTGAARSRAPPPRWTPPKDAISPPRLNLATRRFAAQSEAWSRTGRCTPARWPALGPLC